MPPLSNSRRISVSLDPLIDSTSSSNVKSSKIMKRQGTHKIHELKAVVEKAIQNHKTFTVLGPFGCIKQTLKLRGWIEKLDSKERQVNIKQGKCAFQEINTNDSTESSEDYFSKNGDTLDNIQLSRLLRGSRVDLIWTMKNEPIKWKKLSPKTIVSRFARADFCTKAGLCKNLQQTHWYHEKGVSKILFPRCYNTADEEELSEFIKNFKLTACVSLIRLVCENSISDENTLFQKNGTIPISSVDFALQRCREYIAQQQHTDIDEQNFEDTWDHQWDQFLTYFYKIIQEDGVILSENDDKTNTVQKNCQDLLVQLAEYWSQLHLDGTNNLWILKPAAKSRGRGILIMKKLEDTLLKINSQQGKECRYVVQKYIERPLLIYETKFDIRQWFLVTSAHPLAIWMYKECYLRFCSQVFTLINTHESVHLSNNAIQCKYTNCIRDKNLPDENMWDSYMFQAYLRSKGKSEIWEKVIYPGMRENIIGTLLASQDTMDSRKGCFELFGADFVLSENFEPWLIEINSGPSMSPSTSVTARMCAQVLDDVIKVVVDRKNDKNADTGMFELVYKQYIPPAQPYMGQNLILRGSRMGNARTTKQELFFKSKKRKLSNNCTSTTKLLQPNKEFYNEHRCLTEKNRNDCEIHKRKPKTANKKENSRKSKLSSQEVKTHDLVNNSDTSEDSEKSDSKSVKNKNKEIVDKSVTELGVNQFPCVSVPIMHKLNSLSRNMQISNASEILPPIAVPSG